MTYKEALEKVVRADMVNDVIIQFCPADRDDYTCPLNECKCADCWDREMPKEKDKKEKEVCL